MNYYFAKNTNYALLANYLSQIQTSGICTINEIVSPNLFMVLLVITGVLFRDDIITSSLFLFFFVTRYLMPILNPNL